MTERTREHRLATAAKAQRAIAAELLELYAPTLAADALALARRIEDASARDTEVTQEIPVPVLPGVKTG